MPVGVRSARFFVKHTLFGICYVIASLIVGEVHPFSKETMYDSFPNLAVSFYLSDSANKVLPVKQLFNYSADAIAHNYNNILEVKGFSQNESKAELPEMGKLLWAQIAPHAYSSTNTHGIAVHKVSYFLSSGSLTQNDEIIFEAP